MITEVIDSRAHSDLNELKHCVKYPDIVSGEPLSMKQRTRETKKALSQIFPSATAPFGSIQFIMQLLRSGPSMPDT